MNKNKAQEQRLNYLLEEFRADCDEYKHIEIPESEGEKEAPAALAYEYPYAKDDGT